MILVFDLDDTLYEELDFVRSGFIKVAGFLHDNYNLKKEDVISQLLMRLKKGRDFIFDEILMINGIYSKELVKKCLMIYRLHEPDIHLYPDAIRCMERFRYLPKYIVTDGNKIVQANKIKALKLERFIKFSYITHRYGIRHCKPSDYVFRKICEREKVRPSEVLYIGDNPVKDFVGIKPLGYRTLRILRGNHKDVRLEKRFEADKDILTLDEITMDSLNIMPS